MTKLYTAPTVESIVDYVLNTADRMTLHFDAQNFQSMIEELVESAVVKERDILSKTIQELREELTRRDKVERIMQNEINRLAENQKPVYETSGEAIKVNSPKNFPA